MLSGCTSSPPSLPAPSEEIPLIEKLGMLRAPEDLGFSETRFEDCNPSYSPCRTRFFSVIHFQLLCRDSEGTVTEVPRALAPLVSEQIRWQLGGQNGLTKTDNKGYGQFSVTSDNSTEGQRLILRIGKQFMGFTASEVSKVVLPKNFCG